MKFHTRENLIDSAGFDDTDKPVVAEEFAFDVFCFGDSIRDDDDSLTGSELRLVLLIHSVREKSDWKISRVDKCGAIARDPQRRKMPAVDERQVPGVIQATDDQRCVLT